MDDVERTVHFFEMIENKDFSGLNHLLADDFHYYGPLPDPFNKEIWLAFQVAVQKAFPDWAYNLKKIEKVNDGVDVILEITGTHTEELAIPWKKVEPIAPTGTEVHLPEEHATVKFRDGKLIELRVHATPGGGLPGLIQQLGLD